MSVGIKRDRRSRTASTEIFIRDATEHDLPAIVAIYNAAIATRCSTAQLEPVTVESRKHWVNGEYPFWVAEIDGEVVGWLSFREFLPRCAYRGTVELSVYVSDKHRRCGIASRLLSEAIARAPALGMHSLVGLIFAHNTPSIALFRNAGFERWGLLPRVARIENQARDLTIFGRQV